MAVGNPFYVEPFDYVGSRVRGEQATQFSKAAASQNALRDLMGRADLTTSAGRNALATEAVKIDPQHGLQYMDLFSRMDDAQLQQARALRQDAGRIAMQIGSAPEPMRPSLWQQARQLYPEVFDSDYRPGAEQLIAAEGASFDQLWEQYHADRKRQDALSALGVGGSTGQATPNAPTGLPGGPGGAIQTEPLGPLGYRQRLMGLESAGGAVTDNPMSSATGNYQFMPDTWTDLGMDPARIGDPAAQEEALSKFLAGNAARFQQRFGRPPTDAEQYAMHRFGAEGAAELYTAPPDTPIDAIVGLEAVTVNPDLRGKTAGQVRAMLDQRMGGGMTWQGDGSATEPTAAGGDDLRAIFAVLPEWQQQTILAAANPYEELAKFASDLAKAPSQRTITRGGMDINQEYRDGQWIDVGSSPHFAGDKPVGAVTRDVFESEMSLRKEFEALPEVKSYKSVIPVIDAAYETLGRDNRASDLNLVYAVGKIMDPNSVVREGEMVMVTNAGSPATFIEGYINYLSGGGKFTPELRQELIAELQGRTTALEQQYGAAYEQFAAMAGEYGLDAARALGKRRAQRTAAGQGRDDALIKALEDEWLTPNGR